MVKQAQDLGLVNPGNTSEGRHAKVRFLGHRTDIPDLLSAVDLFILPSRMEDLSLALIEAHAAGVPCLATDVGGNREVIEEKVTGAIVPSRGERTA